MLEGYQFSYAFLSRLTGWQSKMIPQIHYNHIQERTLPSPRFSLVRVPQSVQIFLWDKETGDIVASVESYGGAALHDPGVNVIKEINPFLFPYALSVEKRILLATKNGENKRFVLPGYAFESSALADKDMMDIITRRAQDLREKINQLNLEAIAGSPDPIINCKGCAGGGGRAHVMSHITRGDVNLKILNRYTELVTMDGRLIASADKIKDRLFDVCYNFSIPAILGITIWIINDDLQVKRLVNKLRGM